LTIKIQPNTGLEVTKAIQSIWKNSFPEKTANIQNLKDHRYSGAISGELEIGWRRCPDCHNNRCVGHFRHSQLLRRNTH
jgi:hypothetical protein